VRITQNVVGEDMEHGTGADSRFEIEIEIEIERFKSKSSNRHLRNLRLRLSLFFAHLQKEADGEDGR
jgi:hypothetical protein